MILHRAINQRDFGDSQGVSDLNAVAKVRTLQINELQEARQYLKESYSYYWQDNPIAKNYLGIVERMLAEPPIAK